MEDNNIENTKNIVNSRRELQHVLQKTVDRLNESLDINYSERLINKLNNEDGYDEVISNMCDLVNLQNMEYKVFISYRREDAAFMYIVYNILADAIGEKNIFVDKKDLYYAPNEWAESLYEALQSSTYIVICIDKYTFSREQQDGKTDWYYKEIETALERQKNEHKVRIIPVINHRPNFDGTVFPMLSKYQDVNYETLGYEAFREKLLSMIDNDCKKKETEKTIAPPPASSINIGTLNVYGGTGIDNRSGR